MTAGAFNHFDAIADAFPGALEGIVTEAMDEIAALAEERAPRAARRRSPSDPEPGTLAHSAAVTVESTGDGTVATLEFSATNEAGEEYAVFEEYGTHNQPARPFIVPAFQAGGHILEGKAASLESRLPR